MSASTPLCTPRRLATKKEVAHYLGLSERTIVRMVEAGRIPYLTVPTASRRGSTRLRFDLDAVDRLILAGPRFRSQ